jgi:MATE family multidrug resistance protein
VAAVALSLLAWVVLFHIADAAQALASSILRAWKITTVPMLIYVAALWGVGLGGGSLLGFDILGGTPDALRGAPGYWAAATGGFVISGIAMCSLLAWTTRQR